MEKKFPYNITIAGKPIFEEKPLPDWAKYAGPINLDNINILGSEADTHEGAICGAALSASQDKSSPEK